jgi:hypothetical protein
MLAHSTKSSNGEVFGAKALYAAMVAVAAWLLLGTLWSPAPLAGTPAKAQNPAVEEVVVTAPAPVQVSG